MAEENQVMKEPQQVQQEPQRVATKYPKKVEVGKRLAAISGKKREVKKREETQNGGVSQYYGIRAGAFSAVIAVGVIGGLGYYIYQSKKGEMGGEQPSNLQQNDPLKTNKFDMD